MIMTKTLSQQMKLWGGAVGGGTMTDTGLAWMASTGTTTTEKESAGTISRDGPIHFLVPEWCFPGITDCYLIHHRL